MNLILYVLFHYKGKFCPKILILYIFNSMFDFKEQPNEVIDSINLSISYPIPFHFPFDSNNQTPPYNLIIVVLLLYKLNKFWRKTKWWHICVCVSVYCTIYMIRTLIDCFPYNLPALLQFRHYYNLDNYLLRDKKRRHYCRKA